MNKKVILYTDGACSGNPGTGGWGAILMYNSIKKEISGYETNTTNNRMELFAVISGLRLLKEKCDVTIYSDSAYTVNAFLQNWLISWVKNGWRKTDGKPVANQDLWQELYDFSNYHQLKFVKVKGHADNEFNNRCDLLATSAIKNNK